MTRIPPLLLLVSLAASSIASAQGVPTAWARYTDWTTPPPGAAGTTQGNPAPDSEGNEVWYFDSTTGDGLGSAQPWYEQPLTPLVWDDSWFSGAGGWATSDDFGALIRAGVSSHTIQGGFTGVFDLVPVCRWKNTTTQSFDVTVVGTIGIGWNGSFQAAFDTPVDVVVAHRDALTGSTTLLYSDTIQKPTPGTVVESTSVIVRTAPITMQRGDELIVSHRGQNPSPSGAWVTMNDRTCIVRAPVGSSFCGPGVSNSLGHESFLGAHGSAAVADGDVTIKAFGIPFNATGIFLASRTQGFVAQPGGSTGNLCLGGAIGRYVGPGEIFNTGVDRIPRLTLDLSAIAGPTGPVAVQPGETWSFQAWHRDAGNTSNFTSGLAVTFE